MENNRKTNQKAIDILCDEIMKAIEVKTKKIVSDAIKKALKDNKYSGSSGNAGAQTGSISYPPGSFCVLQQGTLPEYYWGGEWEKVEGTLFTVSSVDGEKVEFETSGASVWKRIK